MKSGSVFSYFARFNGYFRGFFKEIMESIAPQSLRTNIITQNLDFENGLIDALYEASWCLTYNTKNTISNSIRPQNYKP